MENIKNPGIFEMLALIKEKKITPVHNEYGQVISVNCAPAGLQVSDVRYVKNVMGSTVVGSSLEQLKADEQALREFASTWAGIDVVRLAKVADTLNKDTLSEEDINYLKHQLERYVDQHKEIKRVEVPVERPTQPVQHRGEYPHLFETLYALSDETLMQLKNESLRKGQNEMYNAARKVLRSRGHRV